MFSTTSVCRLVIAAVLSVTSVIVMVPATAHAEAAPGSRGDDAKVGNWVGAPFLKPNNRSRIRAEVGRIKIIERAGDQQSCRNTLFVPANPRRCQSEFASPEIAYGENLDQALNAPVLETVIRSPKSGVVEIQPPTDAKAPALESTARLNVEEPESAEPKLRVSPKLVQPKALEKTKPELPPLLSCDRAGAIVAGYAFSVVKPSDCDGQVFTFNASRNGRSFIVTLNSASGELIQVRKVPQHAGLPAASDNKP